MNAIFPTQYSAVSTKALNAFLNEKYGFNMFCRLLIRNVSDTYLLEDETKKYIFKIYRNTHRSLEEIKAEVELLHHLKNNGAKVAYPIPDKEGKDIQAFNVAEGVRYGVLFYFAPGKPVFDLSTEQLLTVGREMAVNHNISSKVALRYERETLDINSTLLTPLEVIKPAFKDLPEEYEYLRETSLKVIDKLNQFDTKDFGYGYCHYDYLPKNFHFDEKDNITFFDFDFFAKGFLVNDVMTFFVHFFFHVHYKAITQEQADADFKTFIKGYRENRALSEEEIAMIPYLGYMFWMYFFKYHFEHFEDWSNFFFTHKFIKERVGLIKKWVDTFCKF